jgi:hypothetical protein
MSKRKKRKEAAEVGLQELLRRNKNEPWKYTL